MMMAASHGIGKSTTNVLNPRTRPPLSETAKVGLRMQAAFTTTHFKFDNLSWRMKS